MLTPWQAPQKAEPRVWQYPLLFKEKAKKDADGGKGSGSEQMPLVGWGALHGSTPPPSSVYLQGSFQSIPSPGHILTFFSRAVGCHLGPTGRFKVGEGCRAGICKSRENSAWADSPCVALSLVTLGCAGKRQERKEGAECRT